MDYRVQKEGVEMSVKIDNQLEIILNCVYARTHNFMTTSAVRKRLLEFIGDRTALELQCEIELLILDEFDIDLDV